MSDFECPHIGGWLKNSFIDFPGTVASVLFFNGCNLRCPYCHNPDIVTGNCEPVDFGDVLVFLEKRRSSIEGVVLSGGEPTIQMATLPSIAERIRMTGMKVKLDTNGLIPEMISRIAPDYCALDLKTVPRRYNELGYGGNDPDKLLGESIAIVKSMGANAEVRITVAAPFIDDDVIEELLPLLSGVRTIYLQPFKKNGKLLDENAALHSGIAIEKIYHFRDKLALVSEKCEIRGMT